MRLNGIFVKSALLFGLLIQSTLFADPIEQELVIDGRHIITKSPALFDDAYTNIYSGWRFRSDPVRAMQSEDIQNPGFIWAELGEALWDQTDGKKKKSCHDCHQSAEISMRGVRAKMPVWNEQTTKPQSLETQINQCRLNQMQAEPWQWESEKMIAMTTWISLQSRGMSVAVKTEGPISEWLRRGKEIYYTRYGQLDMACNQCHEDNVGKHLRADHLSQGHINGFPVYHLALGSMSSIHKRFAGCMSRIRAIPFGAGSNEFLALEAYLAARGNGLAVETPSVRAP